MSGFGPDAVYQLSGSICCVRDHREVLSMTFAIPSVSEFRGRCHGSVFRRLLTLALAAAISVPAQAADPAAAESLPSAMQASALRLKARVAAEEGDFLQAAISLEQAALLVGDRVTAGKASAGKQQLEAQGGSMADFSSLMTLIMEQTAPPAQWVMNGDETGTMTPYMQGVFFGTPAVSAAMMLALDNSRLETAFQLARTANNNRDVRRASDFRLVSLPRLERHINELRAPGQPVPEEISTLAGLTAVEFLFVFPETGDIVIGGPAGNWEADQAGRFLNTQNGQPTLQLDDLVTLSRTFSNGGRGFFMCTIDPRPEQVKAVHQLASAARLTAGSARSFATQLEQTLGLQNVTVQGVPQNSRVASVIVDADYQMKLVGIGRREGAAGMKSYFDLAGRAERQGASLDALRWWMTVGYDAIRTSPDMHAFEFTGRSVRCLSENQLVAEDGSRKSTGVADSANEKFAELFTTHLPALAENDVLFADLQNIFDLSLCMALIHSQGLQQRAQWNPEVFCNGSDFQTADVEVPTQLMSAANSRSYRGGTIMVQVAGGIQVSLRDLVSKSDNFEVSPQVSGAAQQANPVGQRGNWWWDAAVR